MNFSEHNPLQVDAIHVSVNSETLTVDLADGRTISVPTAWYPRLAHGRPKEWANYKISALGIHWEDLDEDLSIRGLLLGRKSGESSKSLKFWLDNRAKGRRVTFEDFMSSVKSSSKSGRKRRKSA